MTKQIEITKTMLMDQWYSRLKALLLKGTKKKHLPEVSKVKTLKRFYDSVAALMSQNLSDITIRTLTDFTTFMCDIGVRWDVCAIRDDHEFSRIFSLQIDFRTPTQVSV